MAKNKTIASCSMYAKFEISQCVLLLLERSVESYY